VSMAESDRDPEVREMSAWAIGAHSETGVMGAELTRMLRAEPEADVRRRLYEALSEQNDNSAATLLPLIQSETDVAARIAGFNALGEAIKAGASSAEFDETIVPELTNVAVSNESLNVRMRAVFALRRADTLAAQQALEVIARTANPKIALAARHGLKPAK
jgi:HEAT repeat protein